MNSLEFNLYVIDKMNDEIMSIYSNKAIKNYEVI
jgi:hypothetical protein